MMRPFGTLQHRRWICALLASYAMLIGFGVAFAQDVRDPSRRKFDEALNSEISRGERYFFRQGGQFEFTGGVVFEGSVEFVLETAAGTSPVNARDVSIQISQDGTVHLVHAANRYHLSMHNGLACPLSNFVLSSARAREQSERYSAVVYTELSHAEQALQAEMERAGLMVERRGSDIVGVHRDFYRTPFEAILRRADHAAVRPIDPSIERRIIEQVNGPEGGFARSVDGAMLGAYVHADWRPLHTIYLVRDRQTVEKEGIIFRYQWSTSAAGVRRAVGVQMLAVPQQQQLSKTVAGVAIDASQYDAISLFFNAAVLRTLRDVNHEAIVSFQNVACRR